MHDILAFTALEGKTSEAPKLCSLCSVRPAVFDYELSSDDPEFQELLGCCCAGCANLLLRSLEVSESSIYTSNAFFMNCERGRSVRN